MVWWDLWKPMLAGASASLGSDSIMHPADTLRVRMQARSGLNKSLGVAAEFRHIVRTEGPLALYKGYASVIALSAPGNAAFFFSYEFTRNQCREWQNPTAATLVSTAVGTTASTTIYAPMEVVKERCMVSQGRSSMAVLRSVIAQGGVAELYCGWGASLCTWAPYLMVYFMTYEKLKSVGETRWQIATDQPSGPAQLVCAGLSGVIAAALTNPLDVMKTRVQVSQKAAAMRSNTGKG